MTQGDMFGETKKGAVISDCGAYRYQLTRVWSDEPLLPFVMLNPSVADADVDDRTICRCMTYARDRGFGGIVVANLFAYRATYPADMLAVAEPVGPENDEAIRGLLFAAALAGVRVVAAWGDLGTHRGRETQVRALAVETGCDLVCLGTTNAGHPRHPLYRKREQPFEPFSPQKSE